MHLTFACSECQNTSSTDFDADTQHVVCGHCQRSIEVPRGAVDGQRIKACMVCPSRELFVRKDFPQQLGVSIVVLGIVLSCVAWYYHAVVTTFAILFSSVLIDVALYLFMGELVECYRCHAQYRGTADVAEHGAFDLETHEKYRQRRLRGQS